MAQECWRAMRASGGGAAVVGAELVLRCSQVYKAMRRHVQECAVKILRNVNKDELTNFQRVGQLRGGTLNCLILGFAFITSAAQCQRLRIRLTVFR